jgi:hypothetical protein
VRHDVRRVWQCPACGRRERTGGDVVQRDCRCRAGEDPPQTTAMRLVEGKEQTSSEAMGAGESANTNR